MRVALMTPVNPVGIVFYQLPPQMREARSLGSGFAPVVGVDPVTYVSGPDNGAIGSPRATLQEIEIGMRAQRVRKILI